MALEKFVDFVQFLVVTGDCAANRDLAAEAERTLVDPSRAAQK